MKPECLMIREEFSALLDDELSSEERERVEDHLADCAECLRALNRFKRVDDAYAGLAAVPAPDGFEDAVKDALRPKNVRPFPFRAVTGTLLAAAAAVLIVVAVWPRTAIAPGDGAFQVSKSLQEAAPRRSVAADPPEMAADEARKTAPAEAESALEMERAAESDLVMERAADIAEPVADSEVFNNAIEGGAESVGQRRQSVAQSAVRGDGLDELIGGEIRVNEQSAGRASGAVEAAMESTYRDEAAAFEEAEEAKDDNAPAGALADADLFTMDAATPAPEAFEAPALRKREAAPEAQAPEDSRLVAQSPEVGRLTTETDATKEEADAAGQELLGAAKPASPSPVASATGPQAAGKGGSRTFEVLDGVWYETGYANEDATEVARGSDLLQTLIERDPTVAELAENDARIVFTLDGRWFALEAKE